jgi:FkbM family methyltransferase
MIDRAPRAITERLLERLALLPPLLKGMGFERVWVRIARNAADPARLIETNLGITRQLRCAIPIHKAQYAFGRPQNHAMERSTLCLANELSKDCAHFLDVGANEGVYTFSVFVACKGKIAVHWFEPDKTLSERLANNLQRNAIAAYGNAVAASDTTGHGTFYRNLTDDASGSLTTYFGDKHATHPEVVNTVRLTDYLQAKEISRSLVKVDVEGAAWQAWSGLSESYERVTYLIMEMLAPDIVKALPVQIIRQTGWHAYYIRDFELVASTRGEFEYVEPFWNWLFCALAPAALGLRLSGTKFRVFQTDSGGCASKRHTTAGLPAHHRRQRVGIDEDYFEGQAVEQTA